MPPLNKRLLAVKKIPTAVKRKKYTLVVSIEGDEVKTVAQHVFAFFHDRAVECGDASSGLGKLYWKAGSWVFENAPAEFDAIDGTSRRLAFSTFSTMPEDKVTCWIRKSFEQCVENIKEQHGLSAALSIENIFTSG